MLSIREVVVALPYLIGLADGASYSFVEVGKVNVKNLSKKSLYPNIRGVIK